MDDNEKKIIDKFGLFDVISEINTLYPEKLGKKNELIIPAIGIGGKYNCNFDMELEEKIFHIISDFPPIDNDTDENYTGLHSYLHKKYATCIHTDNKEPKHRRRFMIWFRNME